MITCASPQPAFFTSELKKGPRAIKVNEVDYVIWKASKSYHVIFDKCMHRSARLSSGMIVNDNIECPYHGWQFDGCGRCVKIPQALPNVQLPLSLANVKNTNYDAQEHDGIVWMHPTTETNNAICSMFDFASNPSYIVTEKAFDAPYSYYLQIENLLDPAHINFVHDGFQGDKQNAGTILLDHLEVNENFMSATFSHPGQRIPLVKITFWMPSVVEVSVYGGDDVVRKNIIYVVPSTDKSCRVLFRDVVVTKHIAPQEPFSKLLVGLISRSYPYKSINTSIVDCIFKQDLAVLEGQQANIPNYNKSKYILPTESDRLIVEFRRWTKRNFMFP